MAGAATPTSAAGLAFLTASRASRAASAPRVPLTRPLASPLAVGMTIPPRLANSKKQVDTAKEVARLQEKVTITDDCLRICPFCNSMLTRSLEKKVLSKKADSKPPAVILYQSMMSAMATVKEKLDPYNELVESMWSVPPRPSSRPSPPLLRRPSHVVPRYVGPAHIPSSHGDVTLYDDAAAQRATIMTCFQDIDKARCASSERGTRKNWGA